MVDTVNNNDGGFRFGGGGHCATGKEYTVNTHLSEEYACCLDSGVALDMDESESLTSSSSSSSKSSSNNWAGFRTVTVDGNATCFGGTSPLIPLGRPTYSCHSFPPSGCSLDVKTPMSSHSSSSVVTRAMSASLTTATTTKSTATANASLTSTVAEASVTTVAMTTIAAASTTPLLTICNLTANPVLNLVSSETVANAQTMNCQPDLGCHVRCTLPMLEQHIGSGAVTGSESGDSCCLQNGFNDEEFISIAEMQQAFAQLPLHTMTTTTMTGSVSGSKPRHGLEQLGGVSVVIPPTLPPSPSPALPLSMPQLSLPRPSLTVPVPLPTRCGDSLPFYCVPPPKSAIGSERKSAEASRAYVLHQLLLQQQQQQHVQFLRQQQQQQQDHAVQHHRYQQQQRLWEQQQQQIQEEDCQQHRTSTEFAEMTPQVRVHSWAYNNEFVYSELLVDNAAPPPPPPPPPPPTPTANLPKPPPPPLSSSTSEQGSERRDKDDVCSSKRTYSQVAKLSKEREKQRKAAPVFSPVSPSPSTSAPSAPAFGMTLSSAPGIGACLATPAFGATHSTSALGASLLSPPDATVSVTAALSATPVGNRGRSGIDNGRKSSSVASVPAYENAVGLTTATPTRRGDKTIVYSGGDDAACGGTVGMEPENRVSPLYERSGSCCQGKPSSKSSRSSRKKKNLSATTVHPPPTPPPSNAFFSSPSPSSSATMSTPVASSSSHTHLTTPPFVESCHLPQQQQHSKYSSDGFKNTEGGQSTRRQQHQPLESPSGAGARRQSSPSPNILNNGMPSQGRWQQRQSLGYINNDLRHFKKCTNATACSTDATLQHSVYTTSSNDNNNNSNYNNNNNNNNSNNNVNANRNNNNSDDNCNSNNNNNVVHRKNSHPNMSSCSGGGGGGSGSPGGSYNNNNNNNNSRSGGKSGRLDDGGGTGGGGGGGGGGGSSRGGGSGDGGGRGGREGAGSHSSGSGSTSNSGSSCNNNNNNNNGGGGGGNGSSDYYSHVFGGRPSQSTSGRSKNKGAYKHHHHHHHLHHHHHQHSRLLFGIDYPSFAKMSKLFNEKLYWLGQQLWTLSVTTMVLLLAIVTTVLHVLILVVSHLWTLVLLHVWKRHLSQGGSKRKQMDEKFAYKIGLDENIKLPATGDEAMQRLLNCRGKDPYSILGLKCHTTDEDIKKYYKKQAILVHPDKNHQTGAEEAFKILHHAFDMIGEPAKRQHYDSQVQQSHQAVRDFADLLEKLNEKLKKEANMMNCDKCGGKHQRIPLSRPWYSARYCQSCKTNHAANEGDVWAESTVLGFLWHYYTCIDGVIYDITEWVSCQKKLFKHMKSNAHRVSYRIEPTTNKTKSFWTGESEVDDFIHDLLNMSRQSSGPGPPHYNNNRYNSSSGSGSFFTPPPSASSPSSSTSTTNTTATAGRNTKRRRRKKKN